MLKDIWLFIKILAAVSVVIAFCILLPILTYVFFVGLVLTFVWSAAKIANEEKDKE